jgi:SAM-dependent methyltransferase
MDAYEVNKNIWSEIYKKGQNNLSYPNENLVRVIYHKFAGKAVNNLKLLDFGFGSGANLLHLKKIGFDVYGAEVSEHARELALDKLGSDFDSSKLILIPEKNELAFEDDFFDVIVAWQVLYYNSVESLTDILAVLKRKLKPGGFFIGTMARTQDHSIANSREISKYERVTNNELGNQVGSMVIAVPTKDDIGYFFNIFQNTQIGYFESEINNIVGSHWIIYGEK